MKQTQLPQKGQVRAAMSGGRIAMFAIIIFSFFVNILMLTGPLFMLQIYDRVLTSGSIPTLVALGMLAAVLYGLFGFLDYIRGRLLVRIGRLLEENLSDKVFYAMSFHALRRTENVGIRPAKDLASLRMFLSGPGVFAFLDLPWVPIYLFVIFLLHFYLGVAAAIAVLLLAVLMIINSIVTNEHLNKGQAAALKADEMNQEALRNFEVAHVMGMRGHLRDRWRRKLYEGMDSQTLASDRGAMVGSISKTLRLVFQSGILGLGAYLAVQQEISPGTMIAASIILARALAPVEQVVAHWRSAIGAWRGWRRLDDVLAKTPDVPKNMELPAPTGHLTVDGLTAFAPGNPTPIIRNVTLDLKPGAGLGILGPTGAGKTTLARALIGSWPHLRGDVRLDGATLDQWDPDQLGKYFGYLSQDVELFEGTIGQNISRFDPQAEAQNIVVAAQAAIVHELVLKFPEGYNTVIGEKGVRLSAGQRQRIGLARALYGNPRVIVLDEPNANLDAQGESALVRAIIEARKRGSIVIIVAHRPSAISALDSLMVLKDGQPIAYGPKDEVLQKVLAKPGAGSNRGPKNNPNKRPPQAPTDRNES